MNIRSTRIIAGLAAAALATGAGASIAAATDVDDTDDTAADITNCTVINHAGDSISVGMGQVGIEELYGDTFDGATVNYSATGGQALIEKTKGVSGADVIANQARAIDDDDAVCWVIAYGTNDANNNAAGGVGPAERIDAALEATGGVGQVFWVAPNVADSTSFAEAADEFTEELRTRARAGELTLIDVSGDVKPSHFASDGIHLTADGYTAMAEAVVESVALDGVTVDKVAADIAVLTDDERAALIDALSDDDKDNRSATSATKN